MTQNDARQHVLYLLLVQFGEIWFWPSREESVAVIETGTNNTASDDNFIRQQLPDMPQCSGGSTICNYCLLVGRMTASSRECLQGFQSRVSASKALSSNARYRLNDGFWCNDGSVIDRTLCLNLLRFHDPIIIEVICQFVYFWIVYASSRILVKLLALILNGDQWSPKCMVQGQL